jgi:hypothetical protein
LEEKWIAYSQKPCTGKGEKIEESGLGMVSRRRKRVERNFTHPTTKPRYGQDYRWGFPFSLEGHITDETQFPSSPSCFRVFSKSDVH